MFDISWSELLILAVVTLIFVGPKDLPRFLGTLGRYAGVVRRHAQEFRQHFDEAMREAELADLKKEVESVRDEMTSSIDDVHRSATDEIKAIESASGEATRDTETVLVSQAAEALDAPAPGDDAEGTFKPEGTG